MSAGLIKFDEFALDCNRYELLRVGRPVKLEKIPMELLILLVTKDGHLVTRHEIIQHLWGSDVFVDTEHGINTAIRKIRLALKDDPERPRFVQTVTGKGYRFIAELRDGNATANGATSEPALVPSTFGSGESVHAVPESAFRLLDAVNGNHRVVPMTSDAQPKADSMLAAAPPTPADKSHPLPWRMISVCVFAALVCLSLVLYFYRRETTGQPTKEIAEFKIIPFTTLPGQEKSPTFSPDGSQIAFAWKKEDTRDDGIEHKFDIYLKATGSESLIQLTHHPADAISLSWSPDGTQIAFQRLGGSESGVYLVPALGGAERRLRSTHAKPLGLSWSPDGQTIAFTDSPTAGGNHRVNLMSVDSSEAKAIPHMAECREETSPAFSPDGKQLAYFCIPQPSRFALYDVDPAGGTPHLIGRYAGWASGIAWSRDKQKLVIARHVEGIKFSELDEITVSDGQLQKLPFGETGGAPAISPRGDKLTFEISHFTGIDIWRRALIRRGAAAEKIIASTQVSWFPQYSPDGKHIVFMSNRTGTDEIWMSNADGTGLVQITKLNNTGTPRWSPDGRKIVFDSRSEGHQGVYIAGIDERVPRRLRTNIEEMHQPFWSHDGKWIYFIGRANSERVFRCSPGGGEAEVLSSQPGSFPQESFGGDQVYFVTNVISNPTLMVISLKKPGSESMVEGMPSVNFGNWAVVPKGIYFFPNDKWSLEYFDFAARKVIHIMELSDEPVMGISVSQDQRSIVYARLQQADTDIMVVENWH